MDGTAGTDGLGDLNDRKMEIEMELDLNELERLANAATPGPWSWTNNEGWAYPQTQVKTEQGTKIARFVDTAPQFCCTVGEALQEWRNAAFIAAANPAVVLELVRRLREAEKEAARWCGIKQRHSVALVRLATGSGSYSSSKAPVLLDAWADMAAAEVDAFDPDAYLAEVDARIAEFERPTQPTRGGDSNAG